MKKMLSILIVFMALVTSAFANGVVTVSYETPGTKLGTAVKKDIEASMVPQVVVSLLEDNFVIKRPLSIVFGGEDGPLFDPEMNAIFIPYDFLVEVKTRFEKSGYAETGVHPDEATMDVLMHTLFHELGHALIAMYDIPVLGKEEDAVDGLADVLLIEYVENGREIAISAADLFDLESEDRMELSENDFSDEHSLDLQRFYTTLCHVYGSDPKGYKDLPGETGLSRDRAEFCVEEYNKLHDDWMTLLKPYMIH